MNDDFSSKPFDVLARDIYDWAVASGNTGQVCTFYELHAGSDTREFSLCLRQDKSFINN